MSRLEGSSKVACPHCAAPKSRVLKSLGVHRLRRCLTCARPFHTREILSTEPPKSYNPVRQPLTRVR